MRAQDDAITLHAMPLLAMMPDTALLCQALRQRYPRLYY